MPVYFVEASSRPDVSFDGEGAMKGVDYLSGNIERWDTSDFPPGKILVHNDVRPAQKRGTGGFWFWLADPDPDQYAPCRCGWAPHIRKHYRVGPFIARPASHGP
jgi:hypothetical protein